MAIGGSQKQYKHLPQHALWWLAVVYINVYYNKRQGMEDHG